MFRWLDEQSNEEIIAIYHPGGYGGTDLKSVAIINNFTHALATYWNGDNAGPPNVNSVMNTLKSIRLVCKKHLIDFYSNCGFKLIGKSDLVHGKDPWYAMVIQITNE